MPFLPRRLLPCLVLLCPALLPLPTLAATSDSASIREFDPTVLSRLGQEIYQHDQLAWKATDVVMAQIGMQRLQKNGARGWIVDSSNPKTPFVRFIRAGAHDLEALCDITFSPERAPEPKVPENRALTPLQRAQANALETAKARFMQGDLTWCGGNPNTAVLDDPDGSGFLVYFLRAKPAMNQVPVGGHYRFTVSADGKTVEQVDRLFASCLTMEKKAPENSTPEMLFMTHLVSATPLETHVFLSLQEGLPFLVSTPDGMAWSIENGELKQMGSMDDLLKRSNSK